MFTLRAYQSAASDAGLNALRGAADAGLLIEPTGSGKSLIIGDIATKLDGPVVVFQPTKELVVQNAEKLMGFGYEPSIFSASLRQRSIGQITLATIGSVRNHLERFRDVRYIIYDEADLVNAKGGELSAFRAALPHSRVLGLTATPFRLGVDGYGGAKLKFLTRTRPRVFTDVVHYTQIGDLLKQGWLCPLVYHEVKGWHLDATMAANTTGADYDDLALQRYFHQTDFRDRTRRTVERLLEVGRKHILVFTRFVEDAEVLAESIPGVAMVSGKTPDKERDAVVSQFRSGEIQVVANVGVLTAGFDFPALDTVVLARPSMSLRLYMQMVGRVVRPTSGKTEAWVVDMVGLTRRFGRLDDLEVRPGGKTGEQWEFASKGRPVTNIYYGKPPDKSKRYWSRQAGPW